MPRCPIAAALAGLLLPALLFLAINPSGAAAQAWGVVISTDTAFLLGALALVGPACGARLRVFLLTLAVADDIGALTVIAVFYTEQLRWVPFLLALLGLVAIAYLRKLQAWRGPSYAVVAIATWVALYESGVHATLVGVMIALILPVYPPKRAEVERAAQLTRAFRQSPNPDYARTARLGIDRAVSVNERLMRLYQPYTSFVIVPIFALANAGVRLTPETLRAAASSPLTWASCRPGPGQARRNHRRDGPDRQAASRQRRARHDDGVDRGRRRPVRDRVHHLAVHRRPRSR